MTGARVLVSGGPWDAVVVGAGPAGSSAAFHLARRGRRVLMLERRRFPRDKSCGDGLTRPAIAALADMGVLDELADERTVRGVRAVLRDRAARDFEYPVGTIGMVVPRRRLDDVLRRRAVTAGASLIERADVQALLTDGGTVRGVRVAMDGASWEVVAPVVVIANGASTWLAERAGVVPRSDVGLGVAIRGYYDDVADVADLLEIHAPLIDPGNREILPSYAWIFPVGETSANVGVGVFERAPHTNVRRLMDRFVAELVGSGRLVEGRRHGAWRGAPLRFDFAPARCAAPGFVAVGDAAGMVSPFSGEGISYALESGRLAAEVIDHNLGDGRATCPALEDYALMLSDRYTGYFETGRRAAHRYRLAWRVLDSTFDNERPLFEVLRRAALFPEGVGELYASRIIDNVAPLVRGPDLRVREDLLAVGEVLLEAIRQDWPFLARAAAVGKGDPGIPFRPALLLLLAAAFGDPRAPGLVEVGAAVELGYLASLAHVSVDDAAADAAPVADPNWANSYAVIVGDFLLARAYLLAARHEPAVTKMIASALSRATEGRAAELRAAFDLEESVEEHLHVVERKTATLCELPCRLGGHLAGVHEGIKSALGEYGRQLGIAYQFADDALAFRGGPGALARGLGAQMSDGVYSLAVLESVRELDGDGRALLVALLERGLGAGGQQAEVVELVTRGGGVDRALTAAEAHAARAREALATVPEGSARIALAALTRYATTRRT